MERQGQELAAERERSAALGAAASDARRAVAAWRLRAEAAEEGAEAAVEALGEARDVADELRIRYIVSGMGRGGAGS